MPLASALRIWVLNKFVPQTTNTHLPLEVGVCLAIREAWVSEPALARPWKDRQDRAKQ